jgi:phosphonate transport system substrate-binding protein
MNKILRINSKCFAAILLSLTLFSLTTANAEPKPDAHSNQELVFGLLPILSPQKLVARFGPLADYLAKKLGRPVRIETAPNYSEFLNRTNDNQRYDILFTAPHFYYLAYRKARYKAIVRVDAADMRAIIATPIKSNIHTLNDLRGHTLSVADPLALGTALVRAHLLANGIDPDKDLQLVATPTHNASLLSAYKGITDAASLMIPPYNRARPEVKNAMRIIAKTAGTPHMPISVAPSLTDEEVRIIQTSLLELGSTEEGKALLKHLSWPGFVKTTPEEYDSLKWASEQLMLPR